MKNPHFQQIIQREILGIAQTLPEGKRKAKNNLTRIASKLGVGASTLIHWQNGASLPRNAQLAKLAQAFRPGPRSTQVALLRELTQARERDQDPDKATLEVAALNYWPFSGTQGGSGAAGSLDEILKGFFRLSQRRAEFKAERTGVDNAEELILGRTNNIHVCMFDTPDRSREMKTFHTPVRIGINCVVLADENDSSKITSLASEVATLLQPKDAQVRGLKKYAPISLKQEVGYLYLKDTVGFSEDQLVAGAVRDLDAETFAHALVAARERYPNKTPFALVDEITALRVLAELASRRKKDPGEWSPVLVFPLSTQAAVRRAARNNLPSYVTGLATVRANDERLVGFLDRGLPMLLAQTELVANQYRILYDRLVVEISKCLDLIAKSDVDCHKRIQALQGEPVGIEKMWNESCAIQFAKYALRLNSIEPMEVMERLNLPWRHIVARVREMIPQAPEGTESVREGRFRIAYLPLGPVCAQDLSDQDLSEFRLSHGRSVVDLSSLGFMGNLLRPFQHLVDPIEVPDLTLRGERPTQDWREDVRIGALETYDRARYWRFYRVPFFVPLNCVVISQDLQGFSMDQVRAALSPDGPPRGIFDQDELKQMRRRFRFIVLDSGAGSELFLRDADGFESSCRRVVKVRHPEAYAKALIAPPLKSQPGAKLIRVLVVQQLNCLNVIELLSREDISAELVFDGSSGIQNPLPELNAAIAVSRESPTWIEFFDYAFPRLLRDGRRRVIDLVKDLRKDTVSYLGQLPVLEKLHQSAEAIADHMLCLEEERPSQVPGWEGILCEVARQVKTEPKTELE